MIRNYKYLLLLFVFFENVFSQENKLYIVDSVPLNEDFVWRDLKINTNEIEDFKIISDKTEMYKIGYKNVDSLIYITTKAYATRSEALKKIPTTKLMQLDNTVWYYKNKPYTGYFIDYETNGKKEREGNMVEGKVEGASIYYYQNGSISKKYMFKNSKLDGNQYNYYNNGNLKSEFFCIDDISIGLYKRYHENGVLYQKYYFRNGRIDGYIDEYYSNGKFKLKFISGFPYYLNPQEKEIRLFFTNSEETYYQFGSGDTIHRKGLKNSKTIMRFLKQMNRLISKHPNIDSYYIHRAVLNYVQDNYDASISDLKIALELEPNNKIVPFYISIMLISKYNVNNVSTTPNDVKAKICEGLLSNNFDKMFYKDYSVEDLLIKYCDN